MESGRSLRDETNCSHESSTRKQKNSLQTISAVREPRPSQGAMWVGTAGLRQEVGGSGRGIPGWTSVLKGAPHPHLCWLRAPPGQEGFRTMSLPPCGPASFPPHPLAPGSPTGCFSLSAPHRCHPYRAEAVSACRAALGQGPRGGVGDCGCHAVRHLETGPE